MFARVRKAGLLCLALAAFAGGPAVARADDVTRATLDNGLRVVIVRNDLAPVVTTELAYLAGSDEAPAAFPGTAHAMEHMMFRGSPGLSKDQLAAVMANMGGDFDADTTNGVTRYYITTPSNHLDVALRVEALRMRGVDVSPESWAKERGAIEQEVSGDFSDPSYKAFDALQPRLFAGTPYAHTPLGTRASFDRTLAAILKAFHERWYVPNNAILVIAGDVNPATTLERVRTLFGSIPARPLPARPEFHFRPVKASGMDLATDEPYGSVWVNFRMPGFLDRDHATALVLASVMASRRAPLYGMGVSGAALAAGFNSENMPHGGVGTAWAAFPRGASSAPVLAKLKAILAEAADGVPADLVEAAKQRLVADLEFDKTSVSGLASAWTQALALEGLDSPEEMKQAIEAVTPEAVNVLAKQVFDPRHAVTVVLTPRSSGKPVAKSGFGGRESFASSPDKPVVLPDWAKAAFEQLPEPASSLKPVSYTLANGLRLIVQPEDISDVVQVFGKVRTNEDLQAPKGKEGVADVLDELFSYGSIRLDRIAFQKALDTIRAHESAGSGFALAVPARHFEAGMALLAQNELHPALPEKDFQVVRRNAMGMVAGQLKSPGFLTHLALQQALLPVDDPAQRHATAESLKSLSLDDVRAFYGKAFRPDMTTIVVVGKVSPEAAKAVVEKTFGGWQVAGPKPEVDYGAVPASKPGSIHVPDGSALQDKVELVQTLEMTRDDPDRFALNLGDEVLGSGFYASWLYRDLRDKTGLVYTVGTRIGLGKHRSTYMVGYGCDPDKVAQARDLVIRDLKRIQSEPVPEDELQRAKGMLLRQIPLAESSFDSIGEILLSEALQDKPLDEMLRAGRRYLELTAGDVQRAYAKHIRPDAFVTAVTGPEPK